MKKKISAILASLMVLMLALAAAGCGGKPTLDKWYEENKTTFDEQMNAANAHAEDDGETFEIKVQDSRILTYSYTLLEEFPTDDDYNLGRLSALYDSRYDTFDSTFSDLYSRIQDETRTKDIIIRLAVYNPDGTELYSRDYTGAE